MKPSSLLLSISIIASTVAASHIIGVQSAHALNVNFLKNSILAEFSHDEMTNFKTFIGNALDSTEDHQEVTWRSTTSELAGKYKVKFTYQSDNNTCRRSLFLLANGSEREAYRFDICKINNQWEIKDTPARRFTENDWAKLETSADLALHAAEIGHPFSWHNTETHNSGVNVITAIYRQSGKNCRDIAISISDSQGESSNGNYSFCLAEDKSWQRNLSPH